MGRRVGLTPQTVAKQASAHALWLKGLTYTEIGRQLHVSRQRAQQLIRPPRQIYNLVRERAAYKCQQCKVALLSGHVHHRQAIGRTPDDFNDVGNLVYLCISCHVKSHGGRARAATREARPLPSQMVALRIDDINAVMADFPGVAEKLRALIVGSRRIVSASEVAAMGGKARAKKLTKQQLSEQARKAVLARWQKKGRQSQ